MHLYIPDTKVSSTIKQHTVSVVFSLVNDLNTHTSKPIINSDSVYRP